MAVWRGSREERIREFRRAPEVTLGKRAFWGTLKEPLL